MALSFTAACSITEAYSFALKVDKLSLDTVNTFSAPYVYNSVASVALIVTTTKLLANCSATFFP